MAYLTAPLWRARRHSRFPVHGWMGALTLLSATAMRLADIDIVTTFLTPILWTGYILAVDGAVFATRGRSMLASDRKAFAWMALLSIGLWLIFEAYNLRLRNWSYQGLPDNAIQRLFGYAWSFATIWPGVLETADLLLAGSGATGSGPRRAVAGWMSAGVVCLVVPIAVPPRWGSYLFGAVWLGFFLLLDPINLRAGRPSLLGDPRRRWALARAGIICGLAWECWNSWAGARWVYTFPILQNWKLFEMPLPGYLGFPAFGLEVFAMYVFVTGALRLPHYEVR